MENTYWNSNGKYEDRVAALDRVIDDLLGDKKHITNSEKQKGKHYHIEMLRRGKNAYYRMFNDGDFPRTLGEALNVMEDGQGINEVLGAEFCRVYSIVKRAEYEEFLQVISPWEREHLLMNV